MRLGMVRNCSGCNYQAGNECALHYCIFSLNNGKKILSPLVKSQYWSGGVPANYYQRWILNCPLIYMQGSSEETGISKPITDTGGN